MKIERKEPIKFSKEGDRLTCEGYTIQPFEGRFIVFNSKHPFGFFDSVDEAKRWLRVELKAKYVNDWYLNNLMESVRLNSIMIKKGLFK